MILQFDLTSGLIFLAVFLFLYNFFRKQSWKRLPPGPPCLPILGSLPFLGATDIREPLRKLTAKYGDVFTIYLGARRVVVLNTYDAMKEALQIQGEAFQDRPPIFFVTEIAKSMGIVSSNGPMWKEQRRFTLSVLRDFGVGKSILEDKIHEEISYFLDSISQSAGQVCDPQISIMYAVSNVVGSLAFGQRLDYDSDKFKNYMDLMVESFEVVGSSGPLTVFPFLQHCPGDPFRCRKIHRIADFMHSEFRQMMEEHKAELNPTDEPKDFIDAYLRELKKNKDMDTYFSEKQLVQIIGDLYGAGTETSSTTLRWALIFMLHHPEVLAKVQAEIDDVLGGRLPTMMDKRKMAYVEATLSEIQRMGDIVPFSVPHCTTEDVSFRDFFIPQGTMILPNLYSVHHNEADFKDPFEFKPSRFLNDDGSYRNIKQLIPFGIGRRLCLGESLARMELFLFFTSLLQRFSPSLPSGQQLPSLTGTLHITNEPPPFKIIFNARN